MIATDGKKMSGSGTVAAEPLTVDAEAKDTWLRKRSAYFLDGRRTTWRRGILIATSAVAVALLMLLHAFVPNRKWNLGSLLETFLPWLGLTVPVLLVLALLRRSATALVAVLLLAAVWLNVSRGLLLDRRKDGGNLMVVTHNVAIANPDPVGTAHELAASGADVLALEEMTDAAVLTYEKALAGTYAHHAVEGTVGLWSRYPITEAEARDDLGWDRFLRAVVETPHGKVAVYVVHLPSVRVRLHAGFTADQRDRGADAIAASIAAEPLHRVVLLGDFNGTTDDRAFAAITAQMRSTQSTAGHGYGFTWPSSFPLMRIDQILVKGIRATSSWTLPRTGSDHLPVAARVELSEER
ncbi:endonuclease/exonuclease/phosphatase family protein [Streptomyces sp. NPDC059718]